MKSLHITLLPKQIIVLKSNHSQLNSANQTLTDRYNMFPLYCTHAYIFSYFNTWRDLQYKEWSHSGDSLYSTHICNHTKICQLLTSSWHRKQQQRASRTQVGIKDNTTRNQTAFIWLFNVLRRPAWGLLAHFTDYILVGGLELVFSLWQMVSSPLGINKVHLYSTGRVFDLNR